MPAVPLFRRAFAAVLTALVLVALVAASPVGAAPAAPAPSAAGAGVATVNLVVTFGRGVSAAARAGVLNRTGATPVRAVPAIGADVVAVPAHSAGTVLAVLRGSPEIDDVEVDVPVRAAATVPNDPEWSKQWGPPKVRGPLAWDTTTGDPGVVVAVLDSGVDASHPDLAGAVLPGIDLVNGDDDAGDDNGHGTAVAGVLAARTDNGTGVAALCWTCSILPVKVLGADGAGSMATVADGIVWAADRGAKVINLSLGGANGLSAVERAVAYARSKGGVVVAAAGNDGVSTPHYPAAYPAVVGVAASDPTDARYPWSNYGSWVDVAAPGCNVSTRQGGGAAGFCGTSSAAPVVAGVAGLAFAATPGVAATAVESAVTSSAVPVGSFVDRGRIDAAGAVLAVAAVEPDPVPALTAVPTAPGAPTSPRAVPGNTEATVGWTAPADDGGSAVTGYEVASSPFGVTATVPAGATSVVVRGLRNGTAYTFSVVALNAVGRSVAAAAPAVTPALDQPDRIAGESRIGTAVALSRETFRSAPAVVVARADAFADALAAAPLAAKVGGPILLTGSRGLDPVVMDEVRRLGATTAYLAGGTTALGAEVESGLRAAGVTRLERVAGDDRFETSRLIAARVGGSAVYVTEGANPDPNRGWPDAVAVSGLAAFQRRPVLLVSRDAVPDATRASLVELGVTTVTVVGGPAAVSGANLPVLADPDGDGTPQVAVSRVSGDTRYDTSRAVAELAVASGAAGTRAWFATGLGWPDALAAGPAAGAGGGVLLLIDGRDLASSPPAQEWLGRHRAEMEKLVLVGGLASISAGVESQISGLL